MRPTRPLLFLPLLIVAAACSGGKAKLTPAFVHDDVYVTGSANNRILLAGNDAWIVNSLSNTVDRVDLTSCTAAQHSCQRTGQAILPSGAGPYDAALFAGSLWVTGLTSNALYRVDPGSQAVTAVLTSTGSLKLSTPQSFGTDGTHLFVSNGNDFGAGPGFLSVVSSSGTIVSNRQTSFMYPLGFTTLPDGSLAVTDEGLLDFGTTPATVSSAGGIDFITAAGVTRTIPLGKTNPGPYAVASPDGAYLFLGDGVDLTRRRVKVSDGSVSTLVLGSGSFLSALVPDGSTLWALSFNDDRIYQVDEASFSTLPVAVGTSGSLPFVAVGPGGAAAKGPVHGAIWSYGGQKHLLVLLTLSNSMTDILLP